MDTPVAALIERKGSAVHAVPSTITIAEAVAEMNKRRIGCVVIMDAGSIAGISPSATSFAAWWGPTSIPRPRSSPT